MVDNEQSDGYDNGNQVDDEVDDEAGNFKHSDEQLDVFRKKKAVDWNQPMTSKQSDELQQIEEIDDEMTDLSQFTNRSSSVELNNPEGIV